MEKQNLSKLNRCILAVLPEISPLNLVDASVETVATWDSMASVMILSTIQQEFDVEITPEDMKVLTSYSHIKNFLIEKGIQ